VDPHRLAEARSLAYHRVIAARIAERPALVERARARMLEWGARHTLSVGYVERWLELLDGPRERLLRVLVEDSEDARALRQSTPFAGVLDARERRAIHRQVREQAGTG
jgi:hypothetical protein